MQAFCSRHNQTSRFSPKSVRTAGVLLGLSVLSLAVAMPSQAQLINAGFESPGLSIGQFTYQPIAPGWTFGASAGISSNGSGFTAGNPGAPEGTQIGFIQAGSTDSFFSQSVTLTAGTYSVNFLAAQRASGGGPTPNLQDFTVSLAGTILGTFQPTTTTYQTYSSNTVTLTGGTYTLLFQGLNTAGGDNTAFIDAVQLAGTSAPEPSAALLFASVIPALGCYTRLKRRS